jgi:hypothetical protein
MNGLAALGGFGVLVSGLFGLASGLVVIGLGQAFDALKEIALNTRAMAVGGGSHGASRSTYGGLGFITALMTILGSLVVLGGLLTTLVGMGAMASSSR